jgi:phosphoketolase
MRLICSNVAAGSFAADRHLPALKSCSAWRCHRSLIADALLVRGIRTEDIMSPTRRQVHTLTPFDMAVLNDLDRFHLAAGVIDRLPALGPRAAYAKQAIHDKLIEHKQYIAAHGEDMPEIRNWKWSQPKATA